MIQKLNFYIFFVRPLVVLEGNRVSSLDLSFGSLGVLANNIFAVVISVVMVVLGSNSRVTNSAAVVGTWEAEVCNWLALVVFEFWLKCSNIEFSLSFVVVIIYVLVRAVVTEKIKSCEVGYNFFVYLWIMTRHRKN